MNTHEAAASEQHAFPIVGIGASAGGLEAIRDLIRSLPTNLGMAYVILQHLDPIHVSTLPALLSQATVMPVSEIAEHVVLQPDHVYIIPPNTTLTLERRVFKLHSRAGTGGHPPHLYTIDLFLSSLAEDQTIYAIGVILSGMGTDGTKGLQAIKDHGGMTFAQALSSAKYPSMPQSALLAGCVDVELAPEGIARELTRLATRFAGDRSPTRAAVDLFAGGEEELYHILQLLLQVTGIDFTGYKSATIKRRLLRRILDQQSESVATYLAYLRDHPVEVEALAQEILIHVTNFFRDPETFREVSRTVFPRMLQQKVPGDPIRIWVMGCSTGEEVYSLAICLLEFLGERASQYPLFLFATDLDREALEKARAGFYPEQALAGVSEARRERFFRHVNGGYQIHKAIRERCVFAHHNISRDPPFSRLDLISCRNVLIYLGSPLQKKILSLFHYALTTDGILLLGASETVGNAPHLFTPLNEKHKLYTKKTLRTRPDLNLAIRNYGREKRPGREREDLLNEDHSPNEHSRHTDLGKLIDQMLLTRYLPTCVVIDHAMEIVYLRGPTSPYLAPASGQPSCHLLKMAHPDLLLELRTTIAQARRCGHAVKKEGLQMHENGGVRMVAIEVTPLQPSLLITEGLLLVLLRETPPAHLPAHLSKGAGSAIFTSLDQADQSSKDERIHQLEQERATLRAETILLVEELEEVNQELQVTSEEIRSSNEELQSINEELETSKEELQLINEELSMTNQELRVRNAQLQAARDYAEAVVETVREPLLVLATDLRISQANRAFYQFFQTTPERTEQRLLFELGNGEWNLPALLSLLKDILPTNHYFHGFEVEQSFPVIGRKILLVNARRILLREQETSLILLACEDITERKAREKQKDDAFIGIASHELKTPLTSLKAYAELLLHRFAQTGDEHAVQLLTKMDRQIDKLISLVQELLDITQMEAGQWNMRRITVDLVALVRESVETLQRMTLTQTIVIEANEKCLIDVDPEGIGRLVTNLLSNAIKYSPIGTTIVVKIAEQSEESNEVTLSVQDFGRGIAPDKHKHLFERFYRVSRSVEETYPGLGLGLYIAAEIVKHHQGRIWVESQEGKGAIFFVTLPKQFRRVNSEGERAEEDAYLTENERARMVHGQERRSDGSKNTGG